MPEKLKRKTERSHEENQERAYVAASRRADRSLDARVQSARMASEIHKKRTGKGFRITEEIVMREEMYEEEDEDLPRSFRLLGSQMRRDSQEGNMSFDGYPNSRLAVSNLIDSTDEEWRENTINKMFSQSFPFAFANFQLQQFSHHVPQGAFYFGNDGMPQAPPPHGFQGFQGLDQNMPQDSQQGMHQAQGMSQTLSQDLYQDIPEGMAQTLSQESYQDIPEDMQVAMLAPELGLPFCCCAPFTTAGCTGHVDSNAEDPSSSLFLPCIIAGALEASNNDLVL